MLGLNKKMFVCVLLFPIQSFAEEVQILDVRLQQQGSNWNIRTMVRHKDVGWEHYVDAWRVVTDDGAVISTRVVDEPHPDSDFYILNGNVAIPRFVDSIVIEARDTKNGWSQHRVKVDLTRRDGPRYRIVR